MVRSLSLVADAKAQVRVEDVESTMKIESTPPPGPLSRIKGGVDRATVRSQGRF